MRALLPLVCALPLAAQTFTADFFKGDPKAVMAACADKARSLKPNDSRLLAEYGRAYLASGDRTRAEAAFAAAILSDPKDGETHFLIGYAWLRNGRVPEALAAFDKMAALDPKGKNALARAAVVLLDAGQEARALELMDRAWNLDRKDWQNCVEFARACVRARRAELAATWFERTVQARPKEERMYNEIALALADAGTPARTVF